MYCVLQPDSGSTKYLTAAQLFQGVTARDLYRWVVCPTAVHWTAVLLRRGAELLAAQPSQQETAAQLSAAYTALAELYMAVLHSIIEIPELYCLEQDLCDEPEAQAEAERYCQLATQADPSNPEAWQCEAQYRLVLGELEQAKQKMEHSLSLWLPQHTEFLETGGGRETELSYHSRLGTVRLLLGTDQPWLQTG